MCYEEYLSEYDRSTRADYEHWQDEKYEMQREIDQENLSAEEFEEKYHEHSTPF